MNRLRIGLSMTILIGTMYAAIGLFDSLTQFAVGVVMACLGVIGYGCVDFLEERRNERLAQARDAVWSRRDGEQ